MIMNEENYGLTLARTIEELKEKKERSSLLLHACCAPCSSYVLEYLAEYFDITLFFFNPNISPKDEYEARKSELARLVCDMPLPSSVKIINGRYSPDEFEEMAKGMESLPEGGARCYKCYEMRLRETAAVAADNGFDYFCTSLSISPYKNAKWLNLIGKNLSEQYGVKYLFSDFKKNNGYKRSCQLSKLYGLYRQDYCGCRFSKEEAERRKANGKIR